MVYGLDGVVRAHGANEKMIGRTSSSSGCRRQAFVKGQVDLAVKGTFWQDYKFTNPVTKKIEPKSMYCEGVEDSAVWRRP